MQAGLVALDGEQVMRAAPGQAGGVGALGVHRIGGDLVRRLFFGGLPEGLAGPLSEALESVYANIIKLGSLPPAVDWHPAEG